MILRLRGKRVESVALAFSPVAIHSTAFRPDGKLTMSADEFTNGYERISVHEVGGETEGPVQLAVETALLEKLERGIGELHAGLEPGVVLFIENRKGVDDIRLRESKKDVIVEGENRFLFHWWVEPLLRIGVYRKL